MDKTKIIYISGYGHSGSTILECLLSVDYKVVGMGELFRLDDEWQSSYTREFFKEASECTKLYMTIQKSLESIGENIYSISELNKFEQFIPRSSYKSRYNRFWSTFFNVFDDYDKKIIVDSSKSSYKCYHRFRRLKNLGAFDLGLIHLIRKPDYILQKTINQNKSGRNRFLKSLTNLVLVQKTAMSWILANSIVFFKPKNFSVIVSFEELCESPDHVLKRIGDAFNLPVDEVIHKVQNGLEIPQTCAISGNMRVRKSDVLVFNPKKSTHDETDIIVRFYAFFLNFIYRKLVKKGK